MIQRIIFIREQGGRAQCVPTHEHDQRSCHENNRLGIRLQEIVGKLL